MPPAHASQNVLISHLRTYDDDDRPSPPESTLVARLGRSSRFERQRSIEGANRGARNLIRVDFGSIWGGRTFISIGRRIGSFTFAENMFSLAEPILDGF